nr:unnamed protein product [Callosobruchus analis]
MTEKALVSKFRYKTDPMAHKPKRTVIIPKGLLKPGAETAINIPRNLTPDVPIFVVPAQKGITARVLPSFGDELSTVYYKKAGKGSWTNTEEEGKRKVIVLRDTLDPDKDNVIYIPKHTNPNAPLLICPPRIPGGPLVAQVLPDFRDRLSGGENSQDLTAVPQECLFEYKKRMKEEAEAKRLGKDGASGEALHDDQEIPQEYEQALDYYQGCDDAYLDNYADAQPCCPIIQAAMERTVAGEQGYEFYAQGSGYQYQDVQAEQAYNTTAPCKQGQSVEDTDIFASLIRKPSQTTKKVSNTNTSCSAKNQQQYYDDEGEQSESEEDDEEDEDNEGEAYYECIDSQDDQEYDNRICSGVPNPGEPQVYYAKWHNTRQVDDGPIQRCDFEVDAPEGIGEGAFQRLLKTNIQQ